MAEERVLGYLSQRFATSEENVATEALIWILRQSAAARAAVIRLAQAAGAPVPDQLHWTGQATRGDLGRPDVAGVDDQQLDRILIEAKFAAELTPR
ncbi:MAG: hypothetical protein JWN77_787, partial [Frankiales bacterium]|nr:hypothetical protein [Frankiales bacterium]